MRLNLATMVVLAAWLGAGSVLAQPGADLEKAKGCPACHAPDTRRIGPAWREIAARHRGDAAAPERLVTMLKDGKRHPRAAGSDAELRALIGYVLGR